MVKFILTFWFPEYVFTNYYPVPATQSAVKPMNSEDLANEAESRDTPSTEEAEEDDSHSGANAVKFFN